MTNVQIITQQQTEQSLVDKGAVLALVREAYVQHRNVPEQTPRSHFLRFPDRPSDRIIALLSRYRGNSGDYAGLKWVSSFPNNTENGQPRAFASIILNDMSTGYPMAWIAASPINAARTAASAALAADAIIEAVGSAPTSIGLIGTGLIGSEILDYLSYVGIEAPLTVYDQDQTRAVDFLVHRGGHIGTLPQALDCDLVVFATTAPAPFVDTPFRAGQVILHISLRDLAPEVIASAQNIVDDPEHAVRERTSLELARDQVGHMDFITGTIPELLAHEVRFDSRPIIVSPFGLGILDLAAAVHVLETATGATTVDFY